MAGPRGRGRAGLRRTQDILNRIGATEASFRPARSFLRRFRDQPADVGVIAPAARTEARVWRRLIALASPGREVVAIHDEASSASCDTPTIAIFVPLTVLT